MARYTAQTKAISAPPTPPLRTNLFEDSLPGANGNNNGIAQLALRQSGQQGQQAPNGQPGQQAGTANQAGGSQKFNKAWLAYWAQTASQASTSFVTVDDNLTLSAIGPTEISGNAPAAEGLILFIIIRVGVQGGQITWDNTVYQNAPVDIDVTLDTESLFAFVGHNGYWLFLFLWTGQPLSA